MHAANKMTSLQEMVFSRIDLSQEGGNITAMKKVTGELTLCHNTRIKDISLHERFAQQNNRCSAENYT